MDQLWVVGISGGSVEFGNLIPDREAVGHFGSPSGRAEPSAHASRQSRRDYVDQHSSFHRSQASIITRPTT
jgi:hypothetical protein